MKICLNMIVKNEAKIIERALRSAQDHISCAVIADTGSTDDTVRIMETFFTENNIPYEIVHTTFQDFAQARNFALEAAKRSAFDHDWIMLFDADMELVVSDESAFRALDDEIGYNAEQRSGLIHYANVRLIRRAADSKYVGVTHEYLALPREATFTDSFYFIDHAEGSNRKDKLVRDERLLRLGLLKEPTNVRYIFYLAQTLFEKGELPEAKALYGLRSKLGEFEEEAWYAGMMEALCEKDLGNHEAFIAKALSAYQRRPHRAEPLYHLAEYFQRKGQNDLVTLLCEEGLQKEKPKRDVLFVASGIYEFGFANLFSISGYYADSKRKRAFAAANHLSMDRGVPENVRAAANNNLIFYLAPVRVYLPSWKAWKLDVELPDGYHPMNPSVSNVGGYLDCIVRGVNYEVVFHEGGASYVTPPTPGGGREPIKTRNFYVKLRDGDLSVYAMDEILPPSDMPEPEFRDIMGVEDLRLIYDGANKLVSGTCCELTPAGDRLMTIAKVVQDTSGARMEDLKVILPETPMQPEKNWMPVIWKGRRHFLYSCDPTRLVDETGKVVLQNTPRIDASAFRGGSQLVPFSTADGRGYLCLIHGVHYNQKANRRTYYHRFVWFDGDFNIARVSVPFVFEAARYEFCAGLAWNGKELVMSFGKDDKEAWLGTCDPKEVEDILMKVGDLDTKD